MATDNSNAVGTVSRFYFNSFDLLMREPEAYETTGALIRGCGCLLMVLVFMGVCWVVTHIQEFLLIVNR
jgi:hypothetical protein